MPYTSGQEIYILSTEGEESKLIHSAVAAFPVWKLRETKVTLSLFYDF